jgi:hypothetical protein
MRSTNCGDSGQRGTRQQRSAGGWASRRMPSSERRTVSICRHAHRRSAPASRRVRRVHRAGRQSRSLRTPCLSRPCAGATSPQRSNALLLHPHRHGASRSHNGASVRTRAAGRLGSQGHRRSDSVMIRRRSTCRTATSMHVAPTSLAADATRRMKSYWRNFNDREGELDVRCAASATAAARVRRVEARDDPAPPASPLPQPPPGGGRDGLQEENGDPHAEARTDRHKGAPLHRDALTQIDDVERDCS